MTHACDELPTALTAGDTWRWTRDLPDYRSNEGWTLSYALIGTDSVLEWDASYSTAEDDGSFSITIPASASQVFASGVAAARLIEMATKGGERETTAVGTVTIRPDPTAMVGGDHLDSKRRQLAAIDAYLEGNLADGVQYQMIGTRQIQHIALGELTAYRTRLQAEIAAEESRRSGNALGGRVVTYRYRSA